jgi:hypothetical protein
MNVSNDSFGNSSPVSCPIRFPALRFAVFDVIAKGSPSPKLIMQCVVRLLVFVRRDMAVNCTV